MTERSFICAISQEQKCQPYFGSHPNQPLPEGEKISLIAPSIKEGDCSYACKFVARHCENGSSQIKCIDFDQFYSPVAHADSFRINIANTYMNILTDRILDVSNEFQNKNSSIH